MGGMSNTLVINEAIRRQAERQAAHSYEMEETAGVYWFPDDREMRVLVTATDMDPSPDGRTGASRFGSDPEEPDDVAEVISVIRPEEFGNLELPPQWGTWQDAILMPERP